MLYRNNQDDYNYLKVRFLSANGSYSRYGSRIRLYYTDTDSLVGMREIGGVSRGSSQNMYDAHFGLDGTQAYDIVIRSTVKINGENIVLDKTVKPELGGVVPIDIGGFIEVRDTIDFILAIDDNDQVVPDKISLHQNYPNPFNPITTIRYNLPEESMVVLKIYDLMGREVNTLINKTENVGYKNIIWDSKDKNGRPVPSGMYFYRLDAFSKESDKKFHETRKMVLIR